MPFGFDYKNGNLVPNIKQESVVKYIFEKVAEYSENPPQQWIDEIMMNAEEVGEIITREEAISRVTLERIYRQVYNELQENEEFSETIAKYNKKIEKRFSFRTINTEKSTPMVSREEWKKTQEVIKKREVNQAQGYVRKGEHNNVESVIERQEKILRDSCELYGYKTKVHTFTIEDPMLEYPMLKKLFESAEGNCIDKIVVTSVDRLADNDEEKKAIREILNKIAIEISEENPSVVNDSNMRSHLSKSDDSK